MKKLLLIPLSLGLITGLFAQQKSMQVKTAPINSTLELNKISNQQLINANLPKSIVCQDTLHYPFLKEQIVGGGNFYVFEAWASDQEAVSQAFQYSGLSGITVSGAQIFARSGPSNAGAVIVNAGVFNVDANNNPVGSPIQFGSIAISDTNFSMRTIMFNQPANITNNYAIVIAPIPSGPGDILEFYITDAVPAQTTDENLSRFKSNYYTSSNGNWVSIPTLTASFTGGPYDFEAVMAPIVSYPFQTFFNATPNPVCDGTPVTFTNISGPSFVTNHRMYNYQAFLTHFNGQPDSTFAWDLGVTPPTILWGANISPYTYPDTGTYTTQLYYIGGLVGNCFDMSPPINITVNPSDDATFSYSGSTFCIGGPNQTPTVAQPGGTFSATPSGLVIGSLNGIIDLSSSTAGTYTVKYVTSGTCPDSTTQTITITTTPDPSFTYAQTAYCLNDSTNPIANITGSAGVFTISPNTAVINSSNGEIDLSSSSAGTYTVTNTISGGGCPTVNASQTITLNTPPTVSVSPASPSVCVGSSTNLTASGANTYSWTPATGLSSTSGASVTANPSTTTTYFISGTDANGCSNTASVTVTVNPLPNVTFNLSTTNYCSNGAPVNLTGGTPAGGTYSGPGVSSGQFNPATAGVGTHNIVYSYTNSNGCTNTDTVAVTVSVCSGMEESSIANSLIIAPNPVKEQLMISFNNIKSSNVQVNIITADGKLVYSEYAAAPQYVRYLDVTSFAKGLYFIQISSEEGMIHNKIIVQ